MFCKNTFIYIVLIFSPFANSFSGEDYEKIETDYAFSMVSKLNIRSKPSTDAIVLGRLSKGDIVLVSRSKSPVYGDVNGVMDYWYLIKKGELEGYVFGHYLEPYEQGQRLILSRKLEKIVFLNNEGKINNSIDYVSYSTKEQEAVAKYGFENIPGEPVTHDEVNIKKDQFVVVEKYAGWFESERFLYAQNIYNYSGKLIYTESGCSIIIATQNLDRFLVIKRECNDYEDIVYTGTYEIISLEGKKVSSGSFNVKTKYSQGDNDTSVVYTSYVRQNANKFILANNTRIVIINIENGKKMEIEIEYPFSLPEGKFEINVEEISYIDDHVLFSVDMRTYNEYNMWSIHLYRLNYQISKNEFTFKQIVR